MLINRVKPNNIAWENDYDQCHPGAGYTTFQRVAGMRARQGRGLPWSVRSEQELLMGNAENVYTPPRVLSAN